MSTTLAGDGLQGLSIGHEVSPMRLDPSFQGGSLIVFQEERKTVHEFTHGALCPQGQLMLTGVPFAVRVDDVRLRGPFWGTLGQLVAGQGTVEQGAKGRLGLRQLVQLRGTQRYTFHYTS